MRYSATALTFFALLLSSSLFAQSFPTPYAPNFHSAPDSNTTFQYDIPDSTFYSPAAVYRMNYRNVGSTAWNQIAMDVLYQTCSTWTVSGALNYFPLSGNLEYYFRSEVDTIVISQSPKNTANTFPVPVDLLADMGSDPIGDVDGGGGTHLDITACAMSYSDTRIYARLTNNGGGFPTSSGFNFFLYSVGIIDPDATDSAAYAMIYVNVPLVLSAGLYRINPVDSSFTKIGNISTNISGNSLNLACNIADLTAQPGWSTWPPPSGMIFTAPVTATQNLTDLTSNDIGRAGGFVPSSQVLAYGANIAPTLSSPQISFTDDSVSASITFADPDNNLATLLRFVFGGTPFDMVACEKLYQSGTDFDVTVDYDTSGWYEYYFEFSDRRDTVATTPQMIHVQTLLIGDCDGSGSITISDAVFLISYIFAGGSPPAPLQVGDVNCDTQVSVSDAVYLISYIFAGGPPPCNP